MTDPRKRMEPICEYCGGPIGQRNPTGKCDHLFWPDLLSDEAKEANGYRREKREVWVGS